MENRPPEPQEPEEFQQIPEPQEILRPDEVADIPAYQSEREEGQQSGSSEEQDAEQASLRQRAGEWLRKHLHLTEDDKQARQEDRQEADDRRAQQRAARETVGQAIAHGTVTRADLAIHQSFSDRQKMYFADGSYRRPTTEEREQRLAKMPEGRRQALEAYDHVSGPDKRALNKALSQEGDKITSQALKDRVLDDRDRRIMISDMSTDASRAEALRRIGIRRDERIVNSPNRTQEEKDEAAQRLQRANAPDNNPSAPSQQDKDNAVDDLGFMSTRRNLRESRRQASDRADEPQQRAQKEDEADRENDGGQPDSREQWQPQRGQTGDPADKGRTPGDHDAMLDQMLERQRSSEQRSDDGLTDAELEEKYQASTTIYEGQLRWIGDPKEAAELDSENERRAEEGKAGRKESGPKLSTGDREKLRNWGSQEEWPTNEPGREQSDQSQNDGPDQQRDDERRRDNRDDDGRDR